MWWQVWARPSSNKVCARCVEDLMRKLGHFARATQPKLDAPIYKSITSWREWEQSPPADRLPVNAHRLPSEENEGGREPSWKVCSGLRTATTEKLEREERPPLRRFPAVKEISWVRQSQTLLILSSIGRRPQQTIPHWPSRDNSIPVSLKFPAWNAIGEARLTLSLSWGRCGRKDSISLGRQQQQCFRAHANAVGPTSNILEYRKYKKGEELKEKKGTEQRRKECWERVKADRVIAICSAQHHQQLTAATSIHIGLESVRLGFTLLRSPSPRFFFFFFF